MPVEVFCCYARKDRAFLEDLKIHLRSLERQNLISLWSDTDISAGVVWEEEIKQRLDRSDIILLLISPDFISSDYCYDIELQHIIERHKRGEVHVIPIILRPAD